MNAHVGMRTIGLAPASDGAFRVRLVGADPANVAHAILAGRDRRVTVRLAPGDYTAYVESLTSYARVVQTVSIPERGGPRTLTLAVQEAAPHAPVQATSSRPSRAAVSRGPDLVAEKTLKVALSKPLRFSVGLSADAFDDRPGSWDGPEPEVRLTQDPNTRGLVLEVHRCDDWLTRPKWRLTVAVENDQPWHAPLPLFKGGVRVTLTPTSTPHGPDFAATFTPCRIPTAALIASLTRLAGEDAEQVIAWTVSDDAGDPLSFLARKLEDPWAAAAAALLLVRTERVADAKDWINRLARDFPWLPDAAVAGAWAFAAVSRTSVKQTERHCLGLMRSARQRGSPYYMLTMALAGEILTALAAGAQDNGVRSAAKDEREAWAKHSRRALRTGAIMSREHAGAAYRSGNLPKASYSVIADGKLTGDDVRCRQIEGD